MSSLITSLLFKILSTKAIETVLGIVLTFFAFPLCFGLSNENINYPQWKTNTVGVIQCVVALSGGMDMYCNSSRPSQPWYLIEEKPHQFEYWWFFCKLSLFCDNASGYLAFDMCSSAQIFLHIQLDDGHVQIFGHTSTVVHTHHINLAIFFSSTCLWLIKHICTLE